MNEYDCYEKIRAMERIASQYGAGKKYCRELQAMAKDIAQKKYRVAFIGEFNRGKSSLINALIGVHVLPTDILPMTATVIRLVYGAERNIVVRFKDGRCETKTLQELEEFATKQNRAREMTAGSVDEIVLRYPSVLCSNHIEILDTPGLNDDEAMSERTLQVLGMIDAAVVVLSAELPISQTEQNLILDLIERQEIRHIIFAVTFIDKLGAESEKERVLGFMHQRLSRMLRRLAHERFKGNRGLIMKCDWMLMNPSVFGVSALQAERAFLNDNETLLRQSRLPRFKEELVSMLTRAQVEDIPLKTLQKIDWMLSKLPEWKCAEENFLTQELSRFGSRHESIGKKLAALPFLCDEHMNALKRMRSDSSG